ncbi:MAG: RecQ family zinc-binding domain-containing protein, partial [Flavobacteriaceae bacterium]|nr:RecQ family zinc-binding domain-containing protein [Flavobacteriaceae bacterium]
DAQITFIEPREDDKTINRISKTIEQQNDLKKKQVKAVLDYVNNNEVCKSIQLLSYFGEKELEECGICSVCIKKKDVSAKTTSVDINKVIIKQLELGHLSSKDLFKALPFSEEQINNTLKQMLERNIIEVTATNTYKLKHL